MDGRTYGDRCGVARALDAVGERWALLVVRELLLGPKRFTDLHRGLGTMSQNVLTQRLRDLEQAGVVERYRLRPPAGSWVYELTDAGAQLEPVLIALGNWGRLRLMHDDTVFSQDALLLALRTTFDPVAAEGLNLVLDLRLPDDQLELAVVDGTLTMTRRAAEAADVVLDTDPITLRELAFGTSKVADVPAEGDKHSLQRLFDAFAHTR